MKTEPINPQRLRRIPTQFSWIDQRFVRHHYIQRCDHLALSLYLFYLTVADARGMSYYADLRLMTLLSMTPAQIDSARHCLVSQGLIAYRKPFVQVLSLDDATTPTTSDSQKRKSTRESHHVENASQPDNLKANMQKLQAQLRHGANGVGRTNGTNETNETYKRKSQ